MLTTSLAIVAAWSFSRDLCYIANTQIHIDISATRIYLHAQSAVFCNHCFRAYR